MARKSSFIRFGSDYMKSPDPDKPAPESADGKEPERKPRPEPGLGAFMKFIAGVLFIFCVALAVGLFVVAGGATRTNTRPESATGIGGLYLKGVEYFRAGDYEAARATFKDALEKARAVQVESPDSYIASLEAEIERYLAMPALTRGALGARAQKLNDFRKLVKELEPQDIYLQLGDKSGAVLEEQIVRMKPEELARLAPEQVGKLVSEQVASLEPDRLAEILGVNLDPVLKERVNGATMASLREILEVRLEEIVRAEIDRRKYNVADLAELLGDSRLDIVRNFVEGSEADELAKLLETRFNDIERAMADSIAKHQFKITLDTGEVWEGQVLHEGPVDYRFLRSDGHMYTIPKSRVERVEPLLRPEGETEERENESEEKPDK